MLIFLPSAGWVSENQVSPFLMLLAMGSACPA